jgi:Protein of unknown function (DUF2568)
VLELIKDANLALRFLLGLCALVALGYWGIKTGSGAIAEVALGIGAPLVAAVVWGVFVAPRAPVALPGSWCCSYRCWSSGLPRRVSPRRGTEPWR